MFKYLAKLNAYRKTRDALNSMSSRELADVGITRGDIERIARGSVANVS